jgi:hypothetical protein
MLGERSNLFGTITPICGIGQQAGGQGSIRSQPFCGA